MPRSGAAVSGSGPHGRIVKADKIVTMLENEAVKEDGVWKLSVDHTYNTFTASYDGGWMRGVSGQMPGPSKELPPDAPPTHSVTSSPDSSK